MKDIYFTDKKMQVMIMLVLCITAVRISGDIDALHQLSLVIVYIVIK